MRTYQMVSILGLGCMFAMEGAMLSSSFAQAAEQKPVMTVAPARSAAVASGAVEDTLTACGCFTVFFILYDYSAQSRSMIRP